MKIFKLFVISYLGLLIASFLVFYFGDEGILNYNKLLARKKELIRNINDLETINRELKERMWMLRTDPETNRVEARRLTYVSNNEILVKVKSYENNNNYYTIGSLLKVQIPRTNKNLIFKIMGVCFPLVFFLFYLLKRFYRRIRNGEQ